MSGALNTCLDIDSRGYIHSPKSICYLPSLGVFSLHEGRGGRGLCVIGRLPWGYFTGCPKCTSSPSILYVVVASSFQRSRSGRDNKLAMHVPYLDPHITTSSSPVHVSYTTGVYMWRVRVEGGVWGLRTRRTSNMHNAGRTCQNRKLYGRVVVNWYFNGNV